MKSRQLEPTSCCYSYLNAISQQGIKIFNPFFGCVHEARARKDSCNDTDPPKWLFQKKE